MAAPFSGQLVGLTLFLCGCSAAPGRGSRNSSVLMPTTLGGAFPHMSQIGPWLRVTRWAILGAHMPEIPEHGQTHGFLSSVKNCNF